jgi:hypothetical protein
LAGRRRAERARSFVAHLCARLLRDRGGVGAVANDLRSDERRQLGALNLLVLVGEGGADEREIVP